MSINSVEFYNKNADKYLDSIKTANVSDQLEQFLCRMPSGGKILDGGCGTGRDARTMIERGFDVVAFDASFKMAEIASVNTGLNVFVNTFEDVELDEASFDGIWCMSSLIHVSHENMPAVLNKLHNALKPNGFLYCTYKMRDLDFSDGQRSFTCYNHITFAKLIEQTDFQIMSIDIRDDSRTGRDSEKWICALLRKG